MIDDRVSARHGRRKMTDEFHKFCKLLRDNGVDFIDTSNEAIHLQVRGIDDENKEIWSCIINEYSLGYERGLLELWDFETEPEGYLTAEEAFEKVRKIEEHK